MSKHKSQKPARYYRKKISKIQLLRDHNLLSKAEYWAQRLLIESPQQANAYYELGRIYELKDNFVDSLYHYNRCLWINPFQADAWYRKGLIYQKQGQFFRAAEAFGKYIKQRPDTASTNAYLHLAEAFSQLRFEEVAVQLYLKALEQDNTNIKTYFYLAQSLDKLGDIHTAVDCLMSLGKLYPEKLDLLSIMMGYLLEKKGEYTSAIACYDEALRRKPQQILWQLKRDLAYALVPENRAEIEASRRSIETTLERFILRLQEQPIRLRREEFFYLAMLHGNAVYTSYQHFPQRRLFSLLAQVIGSVMSKPERWQEPLRSADRILDQRCHLGIMMASTSVALSYLYVGSMADLLDPESFRVSVFCESPDVVNLFTKGNKHFFKGKHVSYQIISQDIYEATRQMRNSDIDVLFFTEPGWDFRQYALAMFRVAPVQCTSWMTPGTTGLDTMDYFLSSSLLEGPEAQANYTEKLERWPVFPSWVPGFIFPEPVSRSEFGLDEDWHVYACLQNLLKFHPDFDFFVAEILRRDPKGHLVLLSSRGEHLAELLTRRFERRIPDVMERIWIFPELPNDDFLRLMQVSDVFLDPIYYGGGTTSYQALACGLPIVTWPTERLVGRITASVCEHLGYTEGIATSKADYIQKAVKLGEDSQARERIREKLLMNFHQIYEDPKVVDCFTEFLLRVTKPSQASINPTARNET